MRARRGLVRLGKLSNVHWYSNTCLYSHRISQFRIIRSEDDVFLLEFELLVHCHLDKVPPGVGVVVEDLADLAVKLRRAHQAGNLDPGALANHQCGRGKVGLVPAGPAVPNWSQHRIPNTNQHPLSIGAR